MKDITELDFILGQRSAQPSECQGHSILRHLTLNLMGNPAQILPYQTKRRRSISLIIDADVVLAFQPPRNG